MVLTRDQILKADLPQKRVDIEALGGEMIFRALSALEMDALREEENPLHLSIQAIMLSAIDETGARVFGADDFDEVGGLPAGAITEMIAVVGELNGFDVEELVEDLETTPDEDLNTPLPVS